MCAGGVPLKISEASCDQAPRLPIAPPETTPLVLGISPLGRLAMSVPLILIPGLSASHEVFQPQLERFPNVIVPEWPVPQRQETMTQYAERFAATLPMDQPCVLGGMSFGGMLAQEMCQVLHPVGLILIATVRGPEELPLYAKIGRCLHWAIPLLPIRLLQSLSRVLECPGVRTWVPLRRILARQFRHADPELFRCSLLQIIRWSAPPPVSCPVWHIHGDRDSVLPASRTSPDELVPGGGHVLTLTSPEAVNRFIAQCLDALQSGTAHKDRPGE